MLLRNCVAFMHNKKILLLFLQTFRITNYNIYKTWIEFLE